MGQTVKAIVTELDRERRRIKLSIKQMEPTSIDEYIVEHKAGETVTGRIVEARQGQAKVELGEGVFGHCALAEESAQPAVAAPPAADLSALTAMLSAKWKQGVSSSATARPEPPKTGQVRSFRIVKLDQANKRIDVELAG
jgi:small subunit ribosomal protein S1